MPVIASRLLIRLLLRAHGIQSFLGTETVKCVPFCNNVSTWLAYIDLRSLCRYGPYGPSTLGPSSQSNPNQLSASKIAASDAAVLRA